MGLAAHIGNLLCYDNIFAVPVGSAKCIARQRSWGGLMPSQNYSRVQATCERYPDLLLAVKVPGQRPRKSLAQFLVVSFRLQGSLLLPLPRLEIALLLVWNSGPEGPGGCRRHHVDLVE